MSVTRTLTVPENCPARDGVIITVREDHVTISDLVVKRQQLSVALGPEATS
jgi:hypothetical protein